jgi:hypothetical protein
MEALLYIYRGMIVPSQNQANISVLKSSLVLHRNISFVETFLPPFEKTYWAASL